MSSSDVVVGIAIWGWRQNGAEVEDGSSSLNLPAGAEEMSEEAKEGREV